MATGSQAPSLGDLCWGLRKSVTKLSLVAPAAQVQPHRERRPIPGTVAEAHGVVVVGGQVGADPRFDELLGAGVKSNWHDHSGPLVSEESWSNKTVKRREYEGIAYHSGGGSGPSPNPPGILGICARDSASCAISGAFLPKAAIWAADSPDLWPRAT